MREVVGLWGEIEKKIRGISGKIEEEVVRTDKKWRGMKEWDEKYGIIRRK